MTKPGLGWEHQKRRAAMPPPAGQRCPCTGCAKHRGRPCTTLLWPHNSEADHVLARALGGAAGALRWMCAPCNRSRGATLGNQLRQAKRRAGQAVETAKRRAPRQWPQ